MLPRWWCRVQGDELRTPITFNTRNTLSLYSPESGLKVIYTVHCGQEAAGRTRHSGVTFPSTCPHHKQVITCIHPLRRQANRKRGVTVLLQIHSSQQLYSFLAHTSSFIHIFNASVGHLTTWPLLTQPLPSLTFTTPILRPERHTF